jgi:hypothetical protein
VGLAFFGVGAVVTAAGHGRLWTSWEAILGYVCIGAAILCGVGAGLDWGIPKRKTKRSSRPIEFHESERRAEVAIATAHRMAERLRQASSPAELAPLHREMKAWDDVTYEALEPFSAHWAITFGDNVFEEAPPTNRRHLAMLLSAKLARLHTLLEREYDPIYRGTGNEWR